MWVYRTEDTVPAVKLDALVIYLIWRLLFRLVCNIEGCKHARLSQTQRLHFYYYHKEDYKLRCGLAPFSWTYMVAFILLYMLMFSSLPDNGQRISLTRRPDGKVGCACGQEQHARYNYRKVYEMCRKKIHPPANSTQWKDLNDDLVSSSQTRTAPDTSMRVSKRLLPRRVRGAGQAKFESEIKLTNLEVLYMFHFS